MPSGEIVGSTEKLSSQVTWLKRGPIADGGGGRGNIPFHSRPDSRHCPRCGGPLEPERFEISESAAKAINAALDQGRRIVAVGSTSVRTLEHVALLNAGRIVAGRGQANLFILPGFNFRVTRALLTNFHLPQSTLLILVSAFAGRDFVLSAYRRAVEQRYRFYSYGDCMLIL